MYPGAQRGPPVVQEISKKTLKSVGSYGLFHPQESLEKTINTMGTLLGIHPIVP